MCIIFTAILQLVRLPGQAEVGSDVLAPVLDDAVVAWSATAHASSLTLVRWAACEYVLLAHMEPGARKRPVVRSVADALLEVGCGEALLVMMCMMAPYAEVVGLFSFELGL